MSTSGLTVTADKRTFLYGEGQGLSSWGFCNTCYINVKQFTKRGWFKKILKITKFEDVCLDYLFHYWNILSTKKQQNAKVSENPHLCLYSILLYFINNYVYLKWKVYFKHFGNLHMIIKAQYCICFFLKKKMLPIKNTKRFKNKNDKRAKTAFSKPFDPASY